MSQIKPFFPKLLFVLASEHSNQSENQDKHCSLWETPPQTHKEEMLTNHLQATCTQIQHRDWLRSQYAPTAFIFQVMNLVVFSS